MWKRILAMRLFLTGNHRLMQVHQNGVVGRKDEVVGAYAGTRKLSRNGVLGVSGAGHGDKVCMMKLPRARAAISLQPFPSASSLGCPVVR